MANKPSVWHHAKVYGIMPRIAWHKGVMAVSWSSPLGHHAAPCCIYAFHLYRTLWVVTVTSPTKCGHTWRSLVKINPLSTRILLYRDMCAVLLRLGPVMLVDHPRQLASPVNQKKLCKNRGKGLAKCETLNKRRKPSREPVPLAYWCS